MRRLKRAARDKPILKKRLSSRLFYGLISAAIFIWALLLYLVVRSHPAL